MKYEPHQFRFALDIIESNHDLKTLWKEVTDVIEGISDEDIANEFNSPPLYMPNQFNKDGTPKKRPTAKMSLSAALNNLLSDGFLEKKWIPESDVFPGSSRANESWRLDFSKSANRPAGEITGFAVEVAFNHGEAIAWNLLKPTLAGEINHVKTETEIGAGIGIYICAKKKLKTAGAFDNASGEYEKVLRYLNPLFQRLTIPLVIIGLEAPETIKLEKVKDPITKKHKSKVVPI